MHALDHVFYCVGCKVSLCPDCYIEEHMGHPKKRLEDVYGATKKRIDEHYELFKE